MFETFTLGANDVAARREQLRRNARALPDERRQAYRTAHAEAIRDPDTYAALACAFLGGLRHLYLKQTLPGCGAFALLCLTGLLESPWRLVALGFLLGLELPCLFRGQLIVESYNVTGESDSSLSFAEPGVAG